MKGTLSTHVLDQANGKPAVGVRVRLYRNDELLIDTQTNADGRTDVPLLVGDVFTRGTYRIEFSIGEYFASIGDPNAKQFLDIVPIVFVADKPAAGYHVPLLCSPWAYSTYRGS